MAGKKKGGQGMRPGIAMVLCLVFALVVGSALWHLGRDDVPPPPPPVVVADGPTPEQVAAKLADQQAALVVNEDDRIAAAVFGRPPARKLTGPATTVLRPAVNPYTLKTLIALGAARQVTGSTVELVRSVVVLPGARLVINAPGTTLRLASRPDGFVSLVGWSGAITITGTAAAPVKITSWDGAGPDAVPTDGRAYVRAIGADLSTKHVVVSDLGFWSGRTGGIAVTGLADKPATATLVSTEVRHSYYGLYTSDTKSVAVTDSAFAENAVGGVLLHRGSSDVVLERTAATANGGPGIVASRGSQKIVLRQVAAEGNQGDGIRVDGQPIAQEPGPAGASIAGYRDFRIEGSTARGNRDDGIQAVDADNLVVTGNQVASQRNGIVLTGRIAGAQVENNQVTGAVMAGITVRDGASGVVVGGNTVRGGALGIQVRDAQVEARGNTVADATGHALSLVGAVAGSSATGNTLGGKGRSALDVARVTPGVEVVQNGNDVAGWEVEIPLGERILDLVRDHPLLPLWIVVLISPVLLLVVRFRRRRRRAQPYAETEAPAADPADETYLMPLEARQARPRTSVRSHRPGSGDGNRPSPSRPNRSTGAGVR